MNFASDNWAGAAPEILDAVDAGRYGGGGFRPIGDEAYAFANRLSGGR